ncbi:MAG: hypothetical protein HOP17_09095 [Acidobacteria bacterium]|nr:hypothetical protein [Acidobacteriota bacterium]
MIPLKAKIYLVITAVVFFAGVTLFASHWSNRKIQRFEQESKAAKAAAEQTETAARELEQRTAEYKQKIDYLEDSLSALRSIASQQDEELKTLKNNTDNARLSVGRARTVQRIESTTAELCAKLADLGHPCHQ